jgi:cystathionine beta-lyase/cystathionine gamma-synthase
MNGDPDERLSAAGFATRAVHAGERPDPVTRAHQTPIYQTATFSFDTAAAKEDAVDRALAWEPGRFFYSRTGNPTTSALEEKLASLEGAEGAAVGASGMAAVAAALYAHLRAGDHVVCSDDLFVITAELLEQDLPLRGIDVTRVPITDLAAVRQALRPETRIVLTETVSNPHLRVADIPALARLAHHQGALLLVDNTFLSPACYRPLADGADLVLHAATKYLSGHGDVLAGVAAGRIELVDPVRRQLDLLGACPTPIASWLVARGVRTLPLRLRAHTENAAALAAWLQERPEVDWVRHTGLPTHPDHDVARRLFGGSAGGMLSFRLHGGLEAMEAFSSALRLCAIAVSLGEVDTLVYPMPKRGGMFRVSVGVEDLADIRCDFERGLAAVASSGEAR